MKQLGRFHLLRDIFTFSSTSIFSQILGVISSFVVAKILGPTDFGVWNAVSIALVYGAFCDLGILPAMARDLPFYIGQGNIQKASEIRNTAYVTTLVASLLVMVVLVGISFDKTQSPYMVLGLRGMAVVIVLQRVYIYYLTVFRCYNEFTLLSKLQVVFAVINTVFVILLVIEYGFMGRISAAILVYIPVLCYVIFRKKNKPVFKFNKNIAWHLTKIGIPLTLSSIFAGFLTTVDRLMIIKYLDATQLGYFGISLMITSLIFLIPGSVNQVLYPRIANRFGEAQRDILSIENYILTPTIIIAYLVPILIGFGYLILPIVIELFLPQYLEGLSAARIVLIGMFFSSIAGTTDYLLVIVGKLKQYVIIGFCVLFLNISMNFIVLELGWGISGIALSGTLGMSFFYSAAFIGYALFLYSKSKLDFVKFGLKIYLPFIYMYSVLILLEKTVQFHAFSPILGDFPLVMMRVGLFLLCCVPLLYFACKELGVEFSIAGVIHYLNQR